MSFQSFLRSKFATWVILPIFILALLGFGRVYLQKRAIDNEISKLQAQASKVQKDADQLSSLIKYFNTPEYQEKQAREKLNMQKEGEYVVSIPATDPSDVASNATSSKASNFKQWFKYFFHENQ